jgi:hypothetical protein
MNPQDILERIAALESILTQRSLTDDEQVELRRLYRKAPPTEAEKVLTRRSKNNRSKGRRNENTFANKIGGKRDGLPGHPDIHAGPFAVEVKAGGHLPKKVINGLLECSRLAKDKTPVLNMRSSDDKGLYHHAGIVVMWEEDFVDYFSIIKEKVNG